MHDEINVDKLSFGAYYMVVGSFNAEFLLAAICVFIIIWVNYTAVFTIDKKWKAALDGLNLRKKTIRVTIG